MSKVKLIVETEKTFPQRYEYSGIPIILEVATCNFNHKDKFHIDIKQIKEIPRQIFRTRYKIVLKCKELSKFELLQYVKAIFEPLRNYAIVELK